jgi:conjugative transfer signal peptidase TraF
MEWRAMTTSGLFDRVRGTPISRLGKIGFVFGAVFIGSFQICDYAGLRFNFSPSLPLGVYMTTATGRASLVEFCPQEPFGTLSIARGYRDAGACRDGAAPLLKPLVATVGDTVEMSIRGIAVNGHVLPNTAPLAHDTKGRALRAWPFGRYLVAPGTVWVASSYNPRSFDSRYFGAIPTTAIRARVKAVLTL